MIIFKRKRQQNLDKLISTNPPTLKLRRARKEAKAMWAYDSLSDTQLKLLSRGIIDLGGEVDGKMVDYVREAMLRLKADGSPDIEVIITSHGGDIQIGLDIFDFLSSYTGVTTGKVICYAKSMAIIILQACDRRLISPHASLKAHNPLTNRISWNVLTDQNKFNELVADLTAERDKLLRIMHARTGMPIADLENILMEETRLSPEQALELNFVDEIMKRPTDEE